MAQDIRDLLRKDTEQPKADLSKGHEQKFAALLDEHLPQQRKQSFFWLKIAAIGIVLLGIGYVLMTTINPAPEVQVATEDVINPIDKNQDQKTSIGLGDLSPEFKKLEEYYTQSITMGIASLEMTPENQELIDGYLKRLSSLDKEYKKLNAELANVGPNDLTVNALIDNLKLRLDLLFKLKNKLKEFKSVQNETRNDQII